MAKAGKTSEIPLYITLIPTSKQVEFRAMTFIGSFSYSWMLNKASEKFLATLQFLEDTTVVWTLTPDEFVDW